MSIHGPYTFTSGNGKRFTVEVVLDPKRIAECLAQRAKESPNGIATAHSGGVMVKVADEPPQPHCDDHKQCQYDCMDCVEIAQSVAKPICTP